MIRRHFLSGLGVSVIALAGEQAFAAKAAAKKSSGKTAKPKATHEDAPKSDSGPKPVFRGPTDAKVVSLTFDDGPSDKSAQTRETLKILADYGIKASFFLIGQNVVTFPKIVHEIHDHGHEIANHTWSHANLKKSSAEKVESEIVKCNEAIEKVMGFRPTVLRPPYGAYNAGVLETAKKHGLTTVTWTGSGSDWEAKATAESILDGVTKQVGSGYIYLLHDVNPRVVKALPRMIERIKEKGFEFKPTAELLGLKPTQA